MLEIAVITVSDRAYRGTYQDKSGPAIREILEESGIDVEVTSLVVPDDPDQIGSAIIKMVDRDYIFTTGGTGVSPRDVTPDVTATLCERALPGISEMLRRESLSQTPYAVFSRQYAGIRGDTIIVNFPGSVTGAIFCTRLMLPLLEHGVKMLKGEGH